MELPARLIICLMTAFSFLLVPLSSLGDDDVEFTDPGQQTFRSPDSNLEFEQIDPYTGSLKLSHQDVSFPGNGGLDLQIYRTYDTSRSINYTVFGQRWDLHFGRIRLNGSNVAIELQDGTVNSAIKEQPFPQYYIYLTKDFWKVDMEGTPTLQLTDGTEIVFGHGGTPDLEDWHYATEIRKNNNTIHIYYSSGRRVDHVVDSVGRQLDFHYSMHNLYRLDSITCDQDPQGRELVSYGYTSTGILETVTFPDGESWHYQYADFSFSLGISRNWVQQVTTPYGGTVTYGYDQFIRSSSTWGKRQANHIFFSYVGHVILGQPISMREDVHEQRQQHRSTALAGPCEGLDEQWFEPGRILSAARALLPCPDILEQEAFLPDQ